MLFEPADVTDTPGVPAELARSPGTFALHVRGDSMIEELLRDGDVILVQSIPAARDGDLVVAVVRGDPMVKRLFREAGRVLLHPANGRQEPVVADEEDVEIRGVVVAVIRKY